MGYREYVEELILESGLDDSVELLELLESTEDVEDIEDIETYVLEEGVADAAFDRILSQKAEDRWDKQQKHEKRSEASKRGYETRRRKKAEADEAKKAATEKRRNEWLNDYRARKAEAKKAKEEQERLDRRDYKGSELVDAKWGEKRVAPGHELAPYIKNEIKEVTDKGEATTKKHLSAGQIAAAGTAVVVMASAAAVKLNKHLKAVKSAEVDKLKGEIKDLQGEASEVAEECKSGEISASEAQGKLKKIQAKIKVLAAKVAKACSKMKPTKESVVAEICESVENEDITMEEATELLDLLYDSDEFDDAE